jgi:hypothetical protein
MDQPTSDVSRQVNGMSRQGAPPPNTPQNPIDVSKYSCSVTETAEAFRASGISVSDRSVQRYCDSGKLDAVRLNPDTRELATDAYYVFMVNPDSIPPRIAQLREKQEFVHPTVTPTVADASRHDATRADTSRHVEPEKTDDAEGDGAAVADLRSKIKKLQQENRSLEVDKAARDQIVSFLQDDREKLFEQLNSTMTVVAEQGREIGRLEQQLALAAPPPAREGDNAPNGAPDGGVN